MDGQDNILKNLCLLTHPSTVVTGHNQHSPLSSHSQDWQKHYGHRTLMDNGANRVLLSAHVKYHNLGEVPFVHLCMALFIACQIHVHLETPRAILPLSIHLNDTLLNGGNGLYNKSSPTGSHPNDWQVHLFLALKSPLYCIPGGSHEVQMISVKRRKGTQACTSGVHLGVYLTLCCK